MKKYFKVKSEYDNTPILRKRKDGTYTFKNCWYLFKDELYTESERKKLPCSDKPFEIVYLNPKKTYFFFGCRFYDEN